MKAWHRRRVLGAAAALFGAGAGLARAKAEPRVIEMTAQRFRYEPAEVALKVGEAVEVRIRSLDFVHGMNIPDLQRRLDLVPGRVITLAFTPQAPGVIDFVCDNFCGDGHEEMHGRFVIRA